MDVRGGIQLEDHRTEGHLQRAPKTVHPMYGLQYEVDGRVYDGQLQTIAWSISVDGLGQISSQSDGTYPDGL